MVDRVVTLQGCNGAFQVLVVTLNGYRALMMTTVETPFRWDQRCFSSIILFMVIFTADMALKYVRAPDFTRAHGKSPSIKAEF